MTRIDLDGLIHKTALINDLNFHYVEAGEGPLVVLIHGFPEFWYSWRHQIPALVEAGYRVIAPDMRGYNLTDSPARTSNYTVDLLASDVVALIQHAGEQRAHVVGHDWGAAIAWQLAMRYPQHLNQLAILNGPHPKVFGKGFWRPSQLIRSWYMFFFQIPFVPELYTSKRYPKFMRKISTKHYVSKGKLSTEEIDVYSKVFDNRKSLRGPINYYRAAFRHPLAARTSNHIINAKTLVIWGRKDRHLGIRLAEPSIEHVPDCRVEYLDASHWVQQDASSEVNSLLIDFFNDHQG